MYTTDCNYFRVTNYNNVQEGYYRWTGCTDVISVSPIGTLQTSYVCAKNLSVEEYGAPLDVVFIGSCTNGRIEDLRIAASFAKGRKKAPTVRVLVVPGSKQVKKQAEAEGLDQIFKDAGFEWREAGCSMCLAMNPDVLAPGERSASTSNRNFEGRQGKDGRTHLVSPAMAAAAAIEGHFVDVRTWNIDH